jgi:hypothetical protein
MKNKMCRFDCNGLNFLLKNIKYLVSTGDDKDFVKDIIPVDIFYKICEKEKYSRTLRADFLELLKYIEGEFGLEFLKELINYKNSQNRTFLYHLYIHADVYLVEILSDIITKFKNDKKFLEEFLLSVDVNGNTFLVHYLTGWYPERFTKISEICFELLNKNFGGNFLKQLILIENKNNKNLLNILLISDELENNLEIFKILLKIFKSDRKFCDKIEKQKKILDENIEKFLNENCSKVDIVEGNRNCCIVL